MNGWLRVLCTVAVLGARVSLGAEETIGTDARTGAPEEGSPTNRESMDALDVRISKERELLTRRFAIMPHRGTYLLPASWNARANREFDDTTGHETEKLEVKLQLSLKVAMFPATFRRAFHDKLFAFFGYTQQSYWQLWNTKDSAPFRETNYEPELMVTYLPDPLPVLGRALRLATVGFAHQSNGQSEPLSRSWNRLYGQAVFGKGGFVSGVKLWKRVNWLEGGEDDNPDIEDYAGRAEVFTRYVFNSTNSLGLTVRDNLRLENRGSAQIDWSVAPLWADTVTLYLQYFVGYGESLIDFDHVSNRISAGVKLVDWL